MRTDEQQRLSMKTVLLNSTFIGNIAAKRLDFDSRSDVDDLRIRDCLYGTSKIRRLLKFDGFEQRSAIVFWPTLSYDLFLSVLYHDCEMFCQSKVTWQ